MKLVTLLVALLLSGYYCSADGHGDDDDEGDGGKKSYPVSCQYEKPNSTEHIDSRAEQFCNTVNKSDEPGTENECKELMSHHLKLINEDENSLNQLADVCNNKGNLKAPECARMITHVGKICYSVPRLMELLNEIDNNVLKEPLWYNDINMDYNAYKRYKPATVLEIRKCVDIQIDDGGIIKQLLDDYLDWSNKPNNSSSESKCNCIAVTGLAFAATVRAMKINDMANKNLTEEEQKTLERQLVSEMKTEVKNVCAGADERIKKWRKEQFAMIAVGVDNEISGNDVKEFLLRSVKIAEAGIFMGDEEPVWTFDWLYKTIKPLENGYQDRIDLVITGYKCFVSQWAFKGIMSATESKCNTKGCRTEVLRSFCNPNTNKPNGDIWKSGKQQYLSGVMNILMESFTRNSESFDETKFLEAVQKFQGLVYSSDKSLTSDLLYDAVKVGSDHNKTLDAITGCLSYALKFEHCIRESEEYRKRNSYYSEDHRPRFEGVFVHFRRNIFNPTKIHHCSKTVNNCSDFGNFVQILKDMFDNESDSTDLFDILHVLNEEPTLNSLPDPEDEAKRKKEQAEEKAKEASAQPQGGGSQQPQNNGGQKND